MPRITEDIENYIANSGVKEPHSQECEEVILGSIQENNTLLNEVAPILNVEDFYVKKNQIVYQAMLNVAETNSILTPVLLAEELKKLGYEGGLEYLLSVKEKANSETFEPYIKIILEKSRHRKMAQILGKGQTDSLKENASATQVFESVSNELFKLFSTISGTDFKRVDAVGMSVMEHAQALAERGTGLAGLTTGYGAINKMTSGLVNGDLILVAARPSVGKTSLAMGIARNAAILGNVPVGVFSLEMSKESLVQRMLSSEARVDSQKIRNGQMTVNEWKRISRALQTLGQADIYIDDTPLLTTMQLRSKIRKKAFELMLIGKKLGLIVVDYLQLMAGAGKQGENRQQEISTISRELKAIAKEMNCPLVALSQLNRKPEGRQDPRPVLADLRESGALEQDADVVMFIFREEQQQIMPTNVAQAEIIFAKQRNGPTGTVIMGFQKQLTRFENAFPEATGGFELA